jgi:transcriptional regulator with XRE-family HTH domain
MAIFSAERLRARRDALGYTREHLAAGIDRSAALIKNFETGLNYPSIPTLGALARELHCGVAEFFDGDGDPDILGGTPDVPTELGADVDEWVRRTLATAPARIPEDAARRISAAMFGRAS